MVNFCKQTSSDRLGTLPTEGGCIDLRHSLEGCWINLVLVYDKLGVRQELEGVFRATF